jgi:WS/DGAT/MGAT family acyltransferase
MHHSAIDGMGGVQMIFSMFTVEPGQEPCAVPAGDSTPEPVPSQLSMLIKSAPSVALTPVRSAKALIEIGRGIVRGRLAGASRAETHKAAGVGTARLFSGPRLPFNEVPNGTPHKSTSFAAINMADVKRIREIHGCTVNDVALAVSTAAIRRWLADHDALPPGPITSGNPVNTRTVDDQGAFENKFTLFVVQLPTHLADPVERLAVIKAATTSAKAATSGAGTDIADNLFQVLAPGVTELVVGGLTAALDKHTPSPFNTLVTNVQGPPIPLYLAGAKLERMYVQMMQIAGLSLVIAVMTYGGQMFVCITGHRENTPDIWTFAEEMNDEVARLLAAPPADQ